MLNKVNSQKLAQVIKDNSTHVPDSAQKDVAPHPIFILLRRCTAVFHINNRFQFIQLQKLATS